MMMPSVHLHVELIALQYRSCLKDALQGFHSYEGNQRYLFFLFPRKELEN
jgi:hypothetical protein